MTTNLQSTSLIAAELPARQREDVNPNHMWSWRVGKRRSHFKESKKKPKKARVALRNFICNRNGVGVADGEILNNLWTQYAKDFLEKHGINPGTIDTRTDYKDILPKMELIGARIEVKKAKCSSIVGKCGVIIMDSKNMFTLVSDEGRVIHLPKMDLAFELSIQNMIVLFYGKFLTMRIADRCVKAYKSVQSHEF
ncbi:uncharacterized protein LOC129796412 [Lutzomyia longipalpis]|uniref:uncharacterized protein LOC129796412 n=1 Tax=Lutzomyia longipalpis TaxID=7200 RepID=UPI002483A4AD|nr:uncharacterized protein LOC129796412 [Lutzomyia longipalpis]